jgi:hypothetical protein
VARALGARDLFDASVSVPAFAADGCHRVDAAPQRPGQTRWRVTYRAFSSAFFSVTPVSSTLLPAFFIPSAASPRASAAFIFAFPFF